MKEVKERRIKCCATGLKEKFSRIILVDKCINFENSHWYYNGLNEGNALQPHYIVRIDLKFLM